MRKILLISYGEIEYDGRLRSLIEVFSQMGEVVALTRGEKPISLHNVVCHCRYPQFIIKAVKMARKLDKIDWLVLDNRKATIPGMIIKKIIKPALVIQDCRELYLAKEIKHFSGKIGCFFEGIMIRKADIVICANQERASIMKKNYNLSIEPLTFENLRQLQYDSIESEKKAKEKILPLLHEGETRIISTSGCSISRTNDLLVTNMAEIGGKSRLYLVGENKGDDESIIRKIIQDMHLSNVEIIGRLNQSELKYLISHCHIGIVNYGKFDTNNLFCASGKLFEFIYEGIPVVTTTNPPLKRICDDFNVGIADDEYYNGINEVINRYDYYKEAVKGFAATYTIQNNNQKLINDILNRV